MRNLQALPALLTPNSKIYLCSVHINISFLLIIVQTLYTSELVMIKKRGKKVIPQAIEP